MVHEKFGPRQALGRHISASSLLACPARTCHWSLVTFVRFPLCVIDNVINDCSLRSEDLEGPENVVARVINVIRNQVTLY